VGRHGERSDAELLRAAGGGDVDAFGTFYERYGKLVASYAMRRTGDPEVAADVMAEVFAAALAAVRRGRVPAEPAEWIFGVARNKLVDAFRRGVVEERARRELGLPLLELEDTDLDLVRAIAADDAVERLLAELPPDQRAAVRARVLDDLAYDEIATEIGCSALVARKRVSRGLAALRTTMEARDGRSV
jgi:RNA polymerase sigma factor (sigma-70 family)